MTGSNAARASTCAVTPSGWRPTCMAALLDVIATQGGVDRDGAEDYLRRLSDERRYLRDVY